MGYEVVTPPGTDEALAATGTEVIEATKELGLNIDIQGFLHSWITGTRVVVHRNGEGKIDTLAIMAVGKRWIHSDVTASMLELRGVETEGMMNFCRTLAKFAGAGSMFVEQPTVEKLDDRRIYTVHEIFL
mgnify:CR=1 FL=1